MRSFHFSLRLPHAVHDGASRRQHALLYRTLGAYMTNLTRCDLILQRDHDFTGWFAAQSEADQDFMDDCLRDFAKSVPGSQPTLSHHFCAGILKVMIARHRCAPSAAICFLPDCVRALCAEKGFA